MNLDTFIVYKLYGTGTGTGKKVLKTSRITQNSTEMNSQND